MASKYGFDQRLLTTSLEYLAKVYSSFPPNSPPFGDFTIKDVHKSWSFLDMIEDIKYGLKKGVEFDIGNMVSVIHSLNTLGYKN